MLFYVFRSFDFMFIVWQPDDRDGAGPGSGGIQDMPESFAALLYIGGFCQCLATPTPEKFLRRTSTRLSWRLDFDYAA